MTEKVWGAVKKTTTAAASTDTDKLVSAAEDNRVYFYSEVNSTSILTLNKALVEKSVKMKKFAIDYNCEAPPIYLHINSPGGGVFSAFAAVDTIRSSSVPIYSICEGGVASAATLLSTACAKRYIRPTSFMLIHQLSSWAIGKYEELKDDMKNNDKLMEIIYNHYEKYSKIPKKKIQEILKRDLWFDADECKEYGLIDEVWK